MGWNVDDSGCKGVIFDLDGTLYFQKPVRREMLFALLKHYCLHWKQWKYLYGIYLFRKIREGRSFKDQPYSRQLEYVCRKIKVSEKEFSGCIENWMFRFPLKLIEKYKDTEILSYLNKAQMDGKKIIIYSDYPVEEKLQCLQVRADYIFYPGSGGIVGLKPSGEAMRYILDFVRMEPGELLFIGDRDDKDGASARLAGIPFILVHH